MRLSEQRTFINRNATVRLKPCDWDTIQEVFGTYIERVKCPKRRHAAEHTFKQMWGTIGNTFAYTVVKPVPKKKKNGRTSQRSS